MTYGSLFAGAGGIDLGFERAGLRCVWQVECDPTANAVRRRHWPHVEHVRDVAGFSRLPKRVGRWLDRWERPDVVCGGFPCQDVSVAGRRGGLAASRTGLWWQMLRIVTGMRPRYVVWENVPGLASSDGGRDFERVVGSLAERGYFGCVRTLDAQHFGVPQRRRRLFGVFAQGHLGAERCAQVLALADGVSGRAAAVRKARESVAYTLTSSVGRSNEGNRIGNAWNTNYIAHTLRAEGFDASEDGTGRGTPLVVAAYDPRNVPSKANRSRVEPGLPAPTLHTDGLAVAALAACQTRREGKGANTDASSGNLVTAGGVRRLTPRECERLMGWPDDFTRWDDRGRELADGPRYRLCGNGVVAPVAEWIGRRLMEVA